jgi:hypothetical protein
MRFDMGLIFFAALHWAFDYFASPNSEHNISSDNTESKRINANASTPDDHR